MGHGHPHPRPDVPNEGDLGPATDLSIPDSELSPAQLSRRGLMRGVGLLGAGAAAACVLSEESPAAATQYEGDLRWLAGDHQDIKPPE